MSRRNQRLIDRISHYSRFRGDPTNTEDLLTHFDETDEIYDALVVSGNGPEWSRKYMEADEYSRIAQFGTLASAAAALVLYKDPDATPERMTVVELSSALRRILRSEAPSKFRRIKTGRTNRRQSPDLDRLLEQAYKELQSASGGSTRPGWVVLQRYASKLQSAPESPFRGTQAPTEHLVKTFLKSKK